jgi:hypothetical protein
VREFLGEINGGIDIHKLWTPQRLRINDKILMEEIHKLNYSQREVKTFNNFRIYFQVYSLADLTNAQGTEIMEKYRKKNLVGRFSSSSATLWPNQEAPDPQFYSIWLNGIKEICKFNEHGMIEKESVLGEWTQPPHKWISHNSYIHRNHRSVLVRTRLNQWKQYRVVNNNTIHIEYVFDGIIVWDQSNIQEFKPCDVTSFNNKLRVKKRTLKQCQIQVDSANPVVLPNSIQTRLLECGTTKNTKFNHIPNIDDIKEEICICSDGGVKHNTPGVGIAIANGMDIIASNKFKFDKEYNDIHLYRCEGIGVLGAVKSFKILQEHYNGITDGTSKTGRILCDNQ